MFKSYCGQQEQEITNFTAQNVVPLKNKYFDEAVGPANVDGIRVWFQQLVKQPFHTQTVMQQTANEHTNTKDPSDHNLDCTDGTISLSRSTVLSKNQKYIRSEK